MDQGDCFWRIAKQRAKAIQFLRLYPFGRQRRRRESDKAERRIQAREVRNQKFFKKCLDS